jgi:peptidoglycan hydrolase-like protein with peptidoglycan-binding domain
MATHSTRFAALLLAALVAVTIVGWIGARQIRSPAQVAADTAPPKPSPITIPVVRRTLAAKVIVRGTVRFGAPQAVVLATSRIKQGITSDIVTRAPRARTELGPGRIAMTVDGRPVFVLPGAIPMHRDLGPGDRGPDVRQLERALARLGLRPGAVDGLYDADTEAAVAAFYLRRGWDPFGPTDVQLDQLHTAEAAAAQARDARLQAINNVEQAQRTTRPADVAQARIDTNTARETLSASELRVATAQNKLAAAQAAAANASAGESVATASGQRDEALANADVAGKQTALATATEEARQAEANRLALPSDATLQDRQAADAAAQLAAQAVVQAQADLTAAGAAANAVHVTSGADIARAHNDGAKLMRDVSLASAELRRAQSSTRTARRQVHLAALKARLLTRRVDTTTMRAIVASAAQEQQRTAGEVARLARRTGVQVPANEMLFFANLPVRVDAVKAKRGSTVAGRVMNVTNSRLAIDSSLSVSDVKLVRVGDPVTVEDPDLGVTAHGRVTRVARTPGTNGVDPSRFYLAVTPTTSLPSLVGASVKLTIAVKSSHGRVLAVPVSALSIGGDGRSRVQVRRGARIDLVPVDPGLAAEGLAEVRPTGGAMALRPGDLVVVGSRNPTLAVGGGP